MKKESALFIACGLLSAVVSAQNTSTILRKSLANIRSLKSVQYDVYAIQKNPFSTGDTLFTKTHSAVAFDDKGVLKNANTVFNINSGQSVLRDAYFDNTLYSIDLKDSLYSVDKNSKPNPHLDNFVSSVNYFLDKKVSKITLRADTIIAGIKCYNFFIKSYDTVENNNHNYTHNYLFINKATLMPVLTKEIGAGIAEEKGHTMGRLYFFNLIAFSNFRINKEIDHTTFEFNRTGFDPRNTSMLPNGVVAPALIIKDLLNKPVLLSAFKNKVLLVEFGATTCGANPLANPMLNRLNKKYDANELALVSIYSQETPDQLKSI